MPDGEAVVEALLDSFGRLPSRDDPDADTRRTRVRDSGVWRAVIATITPTQTMREIRQTIGSEMTLIAAVGNGDEGADTLDSIEASWPK